MNSRSPLEKVPPLYQRAYEALREALLQGELKPGQRLTEAGVAEWLNISRTPVREAFRQLHREALLEVSHQGRIRVPAIRKQDIHDFFECRTALETTAVANAVLNAQDGDVDRLRRILELTEASSAAGDAAQVMHQNWLFHEFIIELSGNVRMLELLEHVWTRILLIRASIPRDPGMSRALVGEHRRIFRAVEARDVGSAVEQLREHLKKATGRYLTYLDDMGEATGE
ncbi:MAG: GntR family transcriptional regulator [Bacillota bacterium]